MINEAGRGDPKAVKKRLELLKNLKSLELNNEVEKSTEIYVRELSIAPKALPDTVHLAIVTFHKIDYLLTWNCSHLANGTVIKKMYDINTFLGIKVPVLCTLEELME